MRVLLDVSAVPARPAGAGVYTWAMADGLAQTDGVELHLATRRDDTERWASMATHATLHAIVPTSRPARLLWEQTGATRLAATVAPDVWHGPHYTMPLRSPIPTVVTVHDMTFFDHPEWHERTKVPYFRRMIGAAARRAAAIVCVSQHTADRLDALVSNHGTVHVIRHGVDHDRFLPGADPARDRALLAAHGIVGPYIGCVGTIEPRKDLPTLVAAFAPLARARPDLRLVLVGGDGWGVGAVRDAIASSGVATHVLRTGYVEDDVVPALYRRAAAVVYPSREEGFGVPALEALACGAPLVTTQGSALAEVVGDAALTILAGDVDALTEAMRTILDDDERAAELRAAGPRQAAPFTWAASVTAHVAVYRSVAARGRVKAFITGAGGFVGPHLSAHLRACGDEIVASDRRGPQPLDVLDREATRERLERERPDVVYHLAAFTQVGESWREPDRAVRVNVEGTLNVLDAARAIDVRRVLVIGSAEEYGLVADAGRPLTEDTPLRPTTPYGASKVAASYLALQAWLGGGLETVRVRPFNHTGPGQTPNFLVSALADRIVQAEREGRDEVMVGSLDPVRDHNDVRDVVRAYRMLATDGAPGEVYNVCSGRGTSVAEVAELLLERATRPLRLVQDPALVRHVETPRLVGDPAKLRATTGWEPEYTLGQTLSDVLAAARAATRPA